jgi:hypothetical protein
MEQWVVEERDSEGARVFLIDFPPLRWDKCVHGPEAHF